MPVFVIGGSRQSVIQQRSRHADSSGHRHIMGASVRLQTRDCPGNVRFWLHSHALQRVETEEKQRAANRTGRSAPSPTTSKPIFSQPNRPSMLGPPRPHPWDCTSRRWLLRQLPQKHRPHIWNTGHGQQDARSSAVGASESPATHVTKFPHRLPPGLEARGAGILPPTAGGALAFRTPSKTPGSLLLPAEGLALRGFQLLPPIKGISEAVAQQASTTPASHWTWHTNSFCFPFCGCSKTHEANELPPLSLSHTQATKEMENALKQLRCQQLQIMPCALRHGGASEDRAVNDRSLEEVQNCGGWKSFNRVRRNEKHARLSLVMSKIPPELLRHRKRLQRVRSLDLLENVGRFFPLYSHNSPSCRHNFERSRICSSLSWTLPAVPPFDVGQPGVASTVLKWLAAGRVLGLEEWNAVAEFCPTKFSSSPCWSVFACLCCARYRCR